MIEKNEEEKSLNDLSNIKKQIIPKKINFEINKKEIISKIISITNSGFAISLILISFAILNQKQINGNIKNTSIPIFVFILTSIFSLLISFLLSGDLKIFKSFSITSIVILNIIINKFGVQSIPLSLIFISINLIIFVITRLARFIYLIPKSIVISMKFLVTFYLILIQIANYKDLVYDHKHMNIFMIIKFFTQNSNIFTVESILLYIISTILIILLFKFLKKVPWFLIIMIGGNILGWVTLKFQKINTIDKYFFNNSNSISTYLTNNINGLINFDILINQEFYLFNLSISLLIFFESALTMKHSRLGKNSKLKTNFKLELLGLIISNLLGSLIGCLPISLSFPNNYITKQVKGYSRVSFLLALLIITLVSIPSFYFFRFIPTIVINVSITALCILGIDWKELISYARFNKKVFFMIISFIIIGIFFDLIYTFCISLIIFYFIYFLNNEDILYLLEDQNEYMENVINHKNNYISNNNDSIKLYYSDLDLEELKKDVVNKGVIYELRGCFNFIFSKLHINNAAFINKKIIIIDISKIMKFDYDFIEEYYKFIRRLENLDYIVYISGIKAERFDKDYNLKECSWIKERYINDRILFLNHKEKIK